MNVSKNKILLDGSLVVDYDGTIYKPPTLKCSYYQTLVASVRQRVEEQGNWDWITNETDGKVLTAADFERYSKRFAAIYKKHGFSNGDKFYVNLENDILMFPALGGAWLLGGVATPADPSLAPKAISHQLSDFEPKIVLCDAKTAGKVIQGIEDAVQTLGCQRPVVLTFGPKLKGCDDSIANLLEPDVDREWLQDENSLVPVSFTEEDLCAKPILVLWTSGSTGMPKGILLSHQNLANFEGWRERPHTTRFTSVSTLCIFHVGGFALPINGLFRGNKFHFILGNSLTLKKVLDTVAKVKPQFLFMGAHIYSQLGESTELENYDPDLLQSVLMITPTGSTVFPHIEAFFRKKMPNLMAVLNVYGQTESGTIAMNTDPHNLGSVVPGCRLKIKNPETGQLCAPNEVGELCFKSSNMMLGYLKRPEETKAYFDDEGFGHTGDLCYYTENCQLVYVDRLKVLIKYNNNHVSPVELENILMTHPGVQECIVYGKVSIKHMELVSAVVVLKPNCSGATTTEADLVEYVNSRVSPDFKFIRGGIAFSRVKLPRITLGKPARKGIADWVQRNVDENGTNHG